MTRTVLARLLRAAVLGVLMALALLTLAQRASPVSPWWLELTRYLPYPVLLAAGGAALLLSCALGWRWVLASLGALAMVATFTMGLVWNRPEPDPGAAAFRLMTYNLKAAKASRRPGGLAELAHEIARHDPDIVVAQDAHGVPGDAPGAPSPVVALFGARSVQHVGQYVVASRLPLRDCALGQLAVGSGDVGYLRCTVDVRGRALTLVDVHFESPRVGLNAARRDGLAGSDEWRGNHEERLEQAQLLARAFADGPRPLVIAGDLNAMQASPVVGALLGIGLRDAFASAGRGYGYSYGQSLRPGVPLLRIDHILVSPEIGVAACEVGGGAGSAHRPVIARLWLRPP